jgi:uncharacterized protein YdeI (YjbR/CyaY-like superfamily)
MMDICSNLDINRDKAIQECKIQLARNLVLIYGYLQKISLFFQDFKDAKIIPSSFIFRQINHKLININ